MSSLAAVVYALARSALSLFLSYACLSGVLLYADGLLLNVSSFYLSPKTNGRYRSCSPAPLHSSLAIVVPWKTIFSSDRRRWHAHTEGLGLPRLVSCLTHRPRTPPQSHIIPHSGHIVPAHASPLIPHLSTPFEFVSTASISPSRALLPFPLCELYDTVGFLCVLLPPRQSFTCTSPHTRIYTHKLVPSRSVLLAAIDFYAISHFISHNLLCFLYD